jgi:hypothetical protein
MIFGAWPRAVPGVQISVSLGIAELDLRSNFVLLSLVEENDDGSASGQSDPKVPAILSRAAGLRLVRRGPGISDFRHRPTATGSLWQNTLSFKTHRLASVEVYDDGTAMISGTGETLVIINGAQA